MSPQSDEALLAGLFALFNLLVTLWLKRRLEGRMNADAQILLDRAKNIVSREKELLTYLEDYFVKLNSALKAFDDVCSERNSTLDAKAFIVLYSDALGKWGEFTAYSYPKETFALDGAFLKHLSGLKETIDRLTIALSLSSSERARRRTIYARYLAVADQLRDSMASIYREKYAA